MPTEREVKSFIQDIMDRERYSDFMLYLKEQNGLISVTAKRVGKNQTAQEILDEC